jgi:hypothetical protein
VQETLADKPDHIMADFKTDERHRHHFRCLSFIRVSANGAKESPNDFYRLDNQLIVTMFKTR